MAKLFSVCVKPDYRWPTARVAGRQFSKTPEVMDEAYVNDEMRASELLEVKGVRKAQPKPEVEDIPETDEDDDG